MVITIGWRTRIPRIMLRGGRPGAILLLSVISALYFGCLQVHVYANNTFDSSGKLSQLEFAKKASSKGGTLVAVRTSNAVILVARRNAAGGSNTRIAKPIDKIRRLSPNIAISGSGISSDISYLVNRAFSMVSTHRSTFGSYPSPYRVAKEIAEVMHERTLTRGSRPFGASVCIAGYNTGEDTVSLYEVDPLGGMYDCSLSCLGVNAEDFVKSWKSALATATSTAGKGSSSADDRNGNLEKNHNENTTDISKQSAEGRTSDSDGSDTGSDNGNGSGSVGLRVVKSLEDMSVIEALKAVFRSLFDSTLRSDDRGIEEREKSAERNNSEDADQDADLADGQAEKRDKFGKTVSGSSVSPAVVILKGEEISVVVLGAGMPFTQISSGAIDAVGRWRERDREADREGRGEGEREGEREGGETGTGEQPMAGLDFSLIEEELARAAYSS